MEKCLRLEEKLGALAGVTEVSANHRTGRVLVRFDERGVSRGDIDREIAQALRAMEASGERASTLPARRKASRDTSTSNAGHFLMEVALHAFLPAPFDLLLPAAAALRK